MNKSIRLLLISLLCTLSSALWRQTDKLLAEDADPSNPDDAGRSFGSSVAIDGDYLVVGAPFDRSTGEDSGAVYLFQQDGGTFFASQENNRWRSQ